MHTNGFRYKKCTHLTVGTGNVYLNPGKGPIPIILFVDFVGNHGDREMWWK